MPLTRPRTAGTRPPDDACGGIALTLTHRPDTRHHGRPALRDAAVSADITAGEDAADCCTFARACLDNLDQQPGHAGRWLREALNWAARGPVQAQRSPLGALERAEREDEATTVLLHAAVRLAHELAHPPLTPPHQEIRMTTTNQPTGTPEPSTSGPSIAQVVAYIVDRATLADLEPLSGACADREASFRAQRAHAVAVGHTVTIVDISPAWMKGLSGTVESIDHSTRKPRARVRLDSASTDRAHYSTTIPGSVTEHTVQVPLVCLIPQ